MRNLIVLLFTFVALAASAAPANKKLIDYYGQKKSYKLVKADVLLWWGTTTNGCVAFASTALRHVGVEVPQEGRIDDERISLLTLPFSRYLQETLGWERFDDLTKLMPGDLVFTENEEYPLHVFVFDSWKSKKKRTVYAIDNQGFLYARPLDGDDSQDVTASAYALREP